MTKKTIAIIQARMGSSRFPGKSLASIGEWSLVEMVLTRAAKATLVDEVVLATSINASDDVLAAHVEELGFPVFRGSEEDVLARFFSAAESHGASTIVRITGDCPLISPMLIDEAVTSFRELSVDYLALAIGEDRPLAYPRGFDVEVARFTSLARANENADKRFEREHVMPYLYTHGAMFKTSILEPSPNLSRPSYRLCVDTQKDLELIQCLHSHFGSRLVDTDYSELIEFLDANPAIVAINQSVKQKHFTETDKKFDNKIQN